MILLVREGCQFCEGLGDTEGLVKFIVHGVEPNWKVRVNDVEVDLPYAITGLPALVVENQLIQGKTAIFSKLRELGVVQ